MRTNPMIPTLWLNKKCVNQGWAPFRLTFHLEKTRQRAQAYHEAVLEVSATYSLEAP